MALKPISMAHTPLADIRTGLALVAVLLVQVPLSASLRASLDPLDLLSGVSEDAVSCNNDANYTSFMSSLITNRK